MIINYGSFMERKVVLALLILSLMASPALGAIGGNLSEELEPEIVGQLNQTDVVTTPAEESLWLQMRTLWQEHVFWTRMAIVSIIQNSEDKGPVLNRLLRNYEDITETLVPYLGNETANEYGNLIKEHLLIAAELVTAAKEDDQTAFEDANARWYENADKIAAFENTTIPELALEERKAMWYEHLNLTKNETVELLNKDYNTSIDTFDLIEEQASMMADSLANGIILQSPEKFH
jgi:hypothetical protein